MLEYDGLLVVGDVKSGTVYPELFKLTHARQLAHEKIILENLGYPVSERGILSYGKFPSTRTKIRPTQRYPPLRYEKDVYQNVVIMFENLGKILNFYFSNGENFVKELEKWGEEIDKILDWEQKLRYLKAISKLIPLFVKYYKIKEKDVKKFYFN